MTIDPLLFRGLERLLIVVIAGLCLWIAHRIGGGREVSSGTVKWDTFSVELKKVGPSIFFGAFGTAILIYTLASPFSITSTITREGDGSVVEQEETRFLTAQDRERTQRILSGISAEVAGLNGYLATLTRGTLTETEREDLVATIRRLVAQRDDLFTAAFGAQARVRYDDYVRRCGSETQKQSDGCERRRLEFGRERLAAMETFGNAQDR